MSHNDGISLGDQPNGIINRRRFLKLTSASAGASLGGIGLSTFESSTAAAASVLDDFEDGDISEYSGTVDEFDVVSSGSLEGSYSLKTIDNYGKLGHDSVSTPRGYEYKCQVRAGSGSGGKPGLLTCVQNTSYPMNDCYWISLDVPNDELDLFRREGGTSNSLDSVSVSLSEGTEYRIAMELASDTVKGVIYDSSGSQLAATSAVSDATYSSGNLGYYVGGSPGYPVFIDYVTKVSIDSSGSPDDTDSNSFVIAEDFENKNSLDDYEFDRDESGARIINEHAQWDDNYSSPNIYGPAYSGARALEISGTNTEMISTSGLDNYPSAGDTFACWVMAVDGAAKANITYGVQSHTNRYYVHLNFQDDELLLMKYADGSSVVLDSVKSGITRSYDTWYWLEIYWYTDGSHEVELYDIHDNELALLHGSDSTWTSGGIGFDAYLASSGGTVYFDDYIIGTKSSDKGGWGPEYLQSTYTDPTDSNEVDLVYNFESALAYDGVTDSPDGTSWIHWFSVSHINHTYERDEEFSTNPQPNDITGKNLNEINHNHIEVSGADHSSTNDYIIREEDTYAMFLTSTEYEEWKNNNWNTRMTRQEVKQKLIEEQIAEENERTSQIGTLGTIIGTVGLMLGSGPVGAIGVLIAGTAGIEKLTSDPCSTTNPESNTFDRKEWDYCGSYPITGFVSQFYIEVPKGDSVDVRVDNKASPNKNFPLDQIHSYEYHLPGNGDSGELSDKWTHS